MKQNKNEKASIIEQQRVRKGEGDSHDKNCNKLSVTLVTSLTTSFDDSDFKTSQHDTTEWLMKYSLDLLTILLTTITSYMNRQTIKLSRTLEWECSIWRQQNRWEGNSSDYRYVSKVRHQFPAEKFCECCVTFRQITSLTVHSAVYSQLKEHKLRCSTTGQLLWNRVRTEIWLVFQTFPGQNYFFFHTFQHILWTRHYKIGF